MHRVAITLVFLAACDESANDSSPHVRDPRFDALAAAVAADLDRNLATAASVAVWLDGEVIWVDGFGSADPRGGPPPDEDTQFMIGSDTKKIAAISLLRKVAASDAALDTTVAELLPDLAMRLAPDFVTASIHDLLSHQGGIVDGFAAATTTTDEELRSYAYGPFAETYYPLAPPGLFFNYSNPNFSVAGLLDEQLDGRRWADVVEQDLFAPLGMSRTVARKSEVDGNHADGVGFVDFDDTQPAPVSLADTLENAFARPAGLVWSTPSDQMRLARLIVDGDPAILAPDLLDALRTGHASLYPDVPAGSYGYGLFVGRGIEIDGSWYDVPVWAHGGNTLTHTSTFRILPEQRFAISILSNGLGDDFAESISAAISTLVPLPAPGTKPQAAFDPAALDALVGTYVDEHNVGEVQVTRAGDALHIQMPTLDQTGVPYERAMEAISTRVWIAKVRGQEFDFAFIDGPRGETYMRTRQVVAIRRPAGAARPLVRRQPEPARVRAALRQMRHDPIAALIKPWLRPVRTAPVR